MWMETGSIVHLPVLWPISRLLTCLMSSRPMNANRRIKCQRWHIDMFKDILIYGYHPKRWMTDFVNSPSSVTSAVKGVLPYWIVTCITFWHSRSSFKNEGDRMCVTSASNCVEPTVTNTRISVERIVEWAICSIKILFLVRIAYMYIPYTQYRIWAGDNSMFPLSNRWLLLYIMFYFIWKLAIFTISLFDRWSKRRTGSAPDSSAYTWTFHYFQCHIHLYPTQLVRWYAAHIAI
jgi:hypothetical protein